MINQHLTTGSDHPGGGSEGRGGWPALVDVKTFEYLDAADRFGSYKRAGEALQVGPHTMSRAVAAMSARLGYELLTTQNRGGCKVTERGAQVLDWYRRLVRHANGLEAAARALGAEAEKRPVFRVAASTTTSELLMPRWLELLNLGPEDPAFSLVTTRSKTVMHHVQSHYCPVGFIANHLDKDELLDDHGLESALVGEDEIVVVVSSAHPWSKRSSISIEELLEKPHLARDEGAGALDVFRQALGDAADQLNVVYRANDSTNLRETVMKLGGPAALSSLAVAKQLTDRKLHAVHVKHLTPIRRKRRVIWSAEYKRSKLSQRLIAIATLNARTVSRSAFGKPGRL